MSTLLNITESVAREGLAGSQELQQTVSDLSAFTEDPTTILGGPRIFQVWGRRA